MSNKIHVVEQNLTKTDILRALTFNLQQLSFAIDREDPVYISGTTQTKNGVVMECTDGTTIKLKLESVQR
jgi:hypothetical protein